MLSAAESSIESTFSLLLSLPQCFSVSHFMYVLGVLVCVCVYVYMCLLFFDPLLRTVLKVVFLCWVESLLSQCVFTVHPAQQSLVHSSVPSKRVSISPFIHAIFFFVSPSYSTRLLLLLLDYYYYYYYYVYMLPSV